MPLEKGLKVLREYKMREDILDQQASLQRARLEASLADGISWGVGEDTIIEDAEDDGEEVTWQTYKGQLTEKKIKTRDKIKTKRMEKIAHMKKEIDVIRAKDVSQGGLTQGQQTQIAQNEQRTEQRVILQVRRIKAEIVRVRALFQFTVCRLFSKRLKIWKRC